MQKQGWQDYPAFLRTHSLSEAWQAWLLDSGSFMKRLKQHAILAPRVHVLSQQWALLPEDERALLGVSERQYGLVREVLIDSDEGQWMFARTVFPQRTLTGKERRLANLKNRSLGSVLFKDPHVWRSAFDIASVSPGMAWHQQIKQVAAICEESLLARRSLFCIQQKTLLLAEVFLPAIATLARETYVGNK